MLSDFPIHPIHCPNAISSRQTNLPDDTLEALLVPSDDLILADLVGSTDGGASSLFAISDGSPQQELDYELCAWQHALLCGPCRRRSPCRRYRFLGRT